MKPLYHIGIVAGESSGHQLGAALIRALNKQLPNLHFSGLGGEQMLNENFESIADPERIAVMGLVEPLKRLPDILRLRKQLYQHFVKTKPGIVIGIDSPDFNLGLEVKLKKQGIKTVHYISPSVWAWRKRRIFKIKKAVDLMLTLLPFETDIYQQHDIAVKFVGHPMADDMPLIIDKQQARCELGLSNDDPVVVIMPGSRVQEVDFMCPDFIKTALLINQRFHGIKFVIPALNEQRQQQVEAIVKRIDSTQQLNIRYATGLAKTAMAAADVGMLTSGTVVLEAMFSKLPCIAAYRASDMSYPLLKLLIKVPFYTLPNLIANKLLVPEFIQYDIQPQAMAEPIINWLLHPESAQQLRDRFHELHEQLQVNAANTAANAIIELIQS